MTDPIVQPIRPAPPARAPAGPRTLTIPDLSLVVLVGVSGCGKSTFARRHFLPTEVLSSDWFRALVSDDETDQSATTDAFDALHFVARRRLKRGRLTVIDATNVQSAARKPLVALAKEHHVHAVAIVLDISERVCSERNRSRADRQVPGHVIPQQHAQLRRSLRDLRREGFRHVFVLESPDEVDQAVVVREPLWTDRRGDPGPFDVIGDVHGCADELEELLDRLGYVPGEDGVRRHPEGRKAVFLGDLVDRGPRVADVLKIAMPMVEAGAALAVPGNHDVKLVKALRGRNVQVRHGLQTSLDDLARETPEFRERVAAFLDGLVSHYVLDGGRLVVAHAGMKEELQGRASGRVREFALYGDTTGETDELGLPVRNDWAAEYRGQAAVVYGHTVVPRAEWLNRTINIDTGCVFGGSLTALRWPERELVSVPARQVYAEPARPFLPEPGAEAVASAQHAHDELLDLEDVAGKRIVETRLLRTVTIREENAAAALEVMSRFAADPRWLVYLPPTMSPSETSRREGLLEHPAEALDHYRREGVAKVVCEEKHMGSRAVVVACRDEAAARRRFGVDGEAGIVYTCTGRRFFDDPALEAGALAVLRGALAASGFWETMETDWVVLDCELMPWSAKAQELIRGQYAAVGAAARGALSEATAALRAAAESGVDVGPLLARYTDRERLVERYAAAYRRYCWPVASLDDLRLAPFHVLATEGAVHVDRDHLWHLETIAKVRGAAGRLLYPTEYRVVDLDDPAGEEEATAWWEEMTERGGEGMVVKPLGFVAHGRRGLAQPAVKCRGREYLRIIYGPEYTLPENLERLRRRGLGAKRSLALREFALGVEGLERFARGEPLRRVHECVFGVLALESEPVDPRL
ncbi:MAG TPA: polynucleotide kinase-phosphatase [Longimicrobium sp.]|jgi:protein phosphatase